MNNFNNFYPKITFVLEYNSKVLDILIKFKMTKLSQIFTTKPQKLNDYSPKLQKSIPYLLTCGICTTITNKNLRQTRLEELRLILHQRIYPTTLINKGFELTDTYR